MCLLLAFSPYSHNFALGEEDNAEHHVRRLEFAMITYNNTFGTECPPSMAVMGPPPPGENPSARHAGLIGADAATGIRNGYKFEFTCNPSPWEFTITADPVDSVYSDHFFVDQTFVLRQETGAPATVYSLPEGWKWPDTPFRLMRWLDGQVFHYTLRNIGYPSTLADMGPPPKGQKPNEKAANLIDAELASGQKLGYRFHYQLKGHGEYEIRADPVDTPYMPWFLEKPHYFLNNKDGYLHREAHRPATKWSPREYNF